MEVESPKETTQEPSKLPISQAQKVQESPPAETPVAAPTEAKVEDRKNKIKRNITKRWKGAKDQLFMDANGVYNILQRKMFGV